MDVMTENPAVQPTANCRNEQDRKHIVYARNVIDAERLPADRSIADRIDLLQQIRENDRYGKLENHPSFVAVKQVDRRFFSQL